MKRKLETILAAAALAGAYGCSTDGPLRAQTPAAAATTGGFFALSVQDLAASEQWYTEKLGMTVKMRVPAQGGTAVTVLGAGNLLVELVSNDAARSLPSTDPAASERVLLRGPFKVGFMVDNLDAMVASLRARGADIAFGPYPASASQNANVIVRDNAGNLIQIIAR